MSSLTPRTEQAVRDIREAQLAQMDEFDELFKNCLARAKSIDPNEFSDIAVKEMCDVMSDKRATPAHLKLLLNAAQTFVDAKVPQSLQKLMKAMISAQGRIDQAKMEGDLSSIKASTSS